MSEPMNQPREFLDGKVTLYGGDNRDVLKLLPDNSIDSIVTDPPYALVSIQKRFGKPGSAPAKGNDAYMRASAGFMGANWDTGEVAFSDVFWAECLRVLKPGGHVVAFSGTRTYHRMAVAIEDAGFEIRDQLGWLYGSGFPKSHNQHDDWEGWGTALKPAWEPIALARKPLDGTVAANLAKWGVGALNIDGCRVGYDADGKNPATNPLYRKQAGYANGNAADGGSSSFSLKDGSGERNPNELGRWPANIVHDGSDEVLAAFPETKGQIGGNNDPNGSMGYHGGASGVSRPGILDSDSAARFFYQAKADKQDRIGSKHPTVKPVDLMQWLCRLITPPGGIVLDPFAGSGSTGEAAWREGFRCILVEREEEYQADIAERLRLANAGPIERKKRAIKQDTGAGPLFGDNDNASGGGQGHLRQVRGPAARIQEAG